MASRKYRQMSFYMTPEETADFLDISLMAVFQAIYAGRLKVHRQQEYADRDGIYIIYTESAREYKKWRDYRVYKDEKYYTKNEAANYLDTSEDSLDKMRQKGYFEWHYGPDDGKVYYKLGSLKAYMKWKDRTVANNKRRRERKAERERKATLQNRKKQKS